MNNMINLEKFAGGALAEKFNIGLKEVLENIADEERELSIVDIVVKTKLEPTKAVATKILIDKDGQGGVIASEYNNQLKGQQYLRVDEETGEILSDDGDIDMEGIRLIK